MKNRFGSILAATIVAASITVSTQAFANTGSPGGDQQQVALNVSAEKFVAQKALEAPPVATLAIQNTSSIVLNAALALTEQAPTFVANPNDAGVYQNVVANQGANKAAPDVGLRSAVKANIAQATVKGALDSPNVVAYWTGINTSPQSVAVITSISPHNSNVAINNSANITGLATALANAPNNTAAVFNNKSTVHQNIAVIAHKNSGTSINELITKTATNTDTEHGIASTPVTLATHNGAFERDTANARVALITIPGTKDAVDVVANFASDEALKLFTDTGGTLANAFV